MNALETAVREVIAAFRLSRRIGHAPPVAEAALALRLAAEQYEAEAPL
jgi:hypothetical protein